jgi:hypothetical protein
VVSRDLFSFFIFNDKELSYTAISLYSLIGNQILEEAKEIYINNMLNKSVFNIAKIKS